MLVLGLDIALTNVGWVVVKTGGAKPVLMNAGVIHTEKLETGEKMSGTIDGMERSKRIFKELEYVIRTSRPNIIVVESMSWPRNASSATKMALAWGACSGAIEAVEFGAEKRWRPPVIEVGPQAIKLAMAGERSATKEAVEKGAKFLLSDPKLAEEIVSRVKPASRREHCWDALGAVLTSLGTQKYQLLAAGHRSASSQED